MVRRQDNEFPAANHNLPHADNQRFERAASPRFPTNVVLKRRVTRFFGEQLFSPLAKLVAVFLECAAFAPGQAVLTITLDFF
jgi:hypothetical protein